MIVTESSVVVVDHPLLQETLCVIRSKDTKPPEFRRAVTQASMLIAMAATADLPTRPVSVETPLAVAKGREVAVDDFVLIPILRAGLGMVEGIMQPCRRRVDTWAWSATRLPWKPPSTTSSFPRTWPTPRSL